MSLEKKHLIDEKLFQCPICVTTPLANIFQCENGHVLCDQCSSKVGATCPQCRVLFGYKKIRALALEAILDDIPMSCPSKKYGCTIKNMKRHEVAAHNKICVKRAVNICPLLGFTDCKTFVRTDASLITHLRGAHGILPRPNETPTSHSAQLFVQFEDIPINQTKFFFKYIKAKLDEKLERFLLLLKIVSDAGGQTLKCAVIYVGDGQVRKVENYTPKITIYMKQEQEDASICSWIGSPVHYKKAADDAELIPNFSTSMNYMHDRLDPELGVPTAIIVEVSFLWSCCSNPHPPGIFTDESSSEGQSSVSGSDEDEPEPMEAN